MAGYPPGVPPIPPVPPPGYDPRAQRRFYRDQIRARRDALRTERDQMRYQWRSLRRGSILGPTLLIGLGVLFLLIQTGHLDHARFWAWYGQWWPLLLVGAGVILLAEWAFDQLYLRDPQRPPYRRSVGGGVITMLLVLGIVGVVGRHIAAGERWDNGGWHFDDGNFDEIFGDKHESDQILDLTRPNTTGLTISNPRGDITVSGTSDDDRIHVAVHKQIYARTDSEADSKAQQYSPAVDMSMGSPEPSIRMPSLEGARADLVVTVPALTTLTVTANRGDIHVTSLKGAVTATANHGDIELSAISNNPVSVHINSSGSSLTAHNIDGGVYVQGHAQDITLTDVTGPVSLAGEFFGTTHLERINGAIRFHTSRTDLQFARLDGQTEISGSGISADQVLGPVVLTTSNRNITLDRLAGDIAVTNRNGTIDLTAAPALGNITVEDRNGSIRATLPEKANFAIEADATNGNIDTDLKLPTQAGPQNDGHHTTLTGSSGAGGPQIRMTTTNGDISVNKGDVQPLAPAPAAPKITLVPVPPASHPAKH
jgi:DUF4097 and DUF4098 domain-containing protein YvlB